MELHGAVLVREFDAFWLVDASRGLESPHWRNWNLFR